MEASEQVTPRCGLGFWALPPWSQLWEGVGSNCSCVAAFHGARVAPARAAARGALRGSAGAAAAAASYGILQHGMARHSILQHCTGSHGTARPQMAAPLSHCFHFFGCSVQASEAVKPAAGVAICSRSAARQTRPWHGTTPCFFWYRSLSQSGSGTAASASLSSDTCSRNGWFWGRTMLHRGATCCNPDRAAGAAATLLLAQDLVFPSHAGVCFVNGQCGKLGAAPAFSWPQRRGCLCMESKPSKLNPGHSAVTHHQIPLTEPGQCTSGLAERGAATKSPKT